MYSSNYSFKRCISEKEVELLKAMNLAWQQHIMWTRMLLISIAENLDDLNATETRLLQNPRDIANVFEPFYGRAVANEIQRLLTEHLVIGKDLIVALKNNQQTLAQDLTKKWYANADDMANAFSSINPFFPRDKMQKMLYEHLDLTTAEVAARLRKDYVADIKAFDEVQQEILKMSDFFIRGIIRQFPNQFR